LSSLEKKYSNQGKLLGFIGYKVRMIRTLAKDLTPDSLTKNKQIIVPSTLIECPSMKILAIRFYKNKKVVIDILNEKIDKEVKKKIKLPKNKIKILDKLNEIEKKINKFDDIHVIVYSVSKQTVIKKKPDIIEIGLGGNITEKFEFIKQNFDKELRVEDFLIQGQLIDIKGVTKAHGLSGPVKRFGIGLKQHKSEKGRRRPGSIGAWHPARVSFRAPMAGQCGFFTRMQYNSKILSLGSAKDLEKFSFQFPHYGKIKTTYLLIKGSIQGPPKRQLLLTFSLREKKYTAKKNLEILNLLK